MSFRQDVFTNSLGNVLLIVAGVVTGICSARMLGPQGKGELAAITGFSSMIAGIALLGVPNALIYYSAREPERSASYLVAGGVIAVGSATLFGAVAYAAIPWLFARQGSEVIWGARLFLLQIAIYLFCFSPGEVLRGLGRFRQWNVLRVFPQMLMLGVYAFAWSLNTKTALFVATGQLITSSISALPLWYWLRPILRGRLRPSVQQGRNILSFALPSVFGMLPRNLNLRLDQIIMAIFVPASTLGLYVAAVSWSGGSMMLLQAMGQSAFPRIARVQDDELRAKSLAQVTSVTMLMAIMLTIAFLVATPMAVPLLFGSRFAGAVPAALVLVIAGLFAGISGVLEEGLQGLGNPGAILRAEGVGLVVTVAALIVLLGPFQLMGAAIASLLAYVSLSAVLVYEIRLITGLSLSDLLLPNVSDIQLVYHIVRSLMSRLAMEIEKLVPVWISRLD